jgi:YtkA-like
MGSRRVVLVAVVAGVVAAASATAASNLRLSLVGSPKRPEARTPVSIVVLATRGGKPVHAKVAVWIAKGRVRRSFAARAEANGRYRARVVFPSAGRWTFGAQAARTRVTFGSVRARSRAVPLTFRWPTSIDVESSRSLLLVENGVGRDPRRPRHREDDACHLDRSCVRRRTHRGSRLPVGRRPAATA